MISLISSNRFVPSKEVRHLYGWTPLIIAIVQKRYSIIELLLQHNVDVNQSDRYTGAPSMANMLRSNPEEIEAIRINQFSDYLNPNADFSGSTPLHYAALIDDPRLVKRLLDAGAHPTTPNNRGHSPRMYAKSREVVNLLREAESKENQKKRAAERRLRQKTPLETRFRESIVGQHVAIKTVAGAIRRMEMGWQNEEHPLVFLFLGSSGIGKTELAKQIAHYLHKDNPDAFIRIDMSEYQQKHEASKLIGSPPGYVGHDQGGQLTEALAKCPDAVVLFDEMEKAHPDVMTTLLQLFDEGRLTDGKGRLITCKDAVFVMTSNVGSQAIAEYVQEHRQGDDPLEISRGFKEDIMRPLLRQHFKRDEFLGRVNEMVYFIPFSRKELRQIVEKCLCGWRERALKQHEINLEWNDDAVDLLIDGYDVYFGARSLQYEVERKIINQLVVAELKNLIGKHSKVVLVTVDKEPSKKRAFAISITDRERNMKDHVVELHSLAADWSETKS